MGSYFGRFSEYEKDPGKKIAWCTSVGPAELLRSFGFEVYFPENHGALLGATRQAGDYIPASVKRGYAGDICSYLTSDIGAYLNGQTPLQKHYGLDHIPRPDLVVYNTNQCREVQEWFSFFAREFDCPLAGIHPPRHLHQVTREDIRNVVKGFKGLIPVCEKVSGKKFDLDRYKEVIRLSRDASVLWKKVLETAKNTPAPINFLDSCIHMGPIVVLRGDQAAVDYYQALYKELNDKVKKGTGQLDEEHCRLYWDGMPIWGKLRMFSDLFYQNNASVVASTYCNSWIFDTLDEEAPFESAAHAYTRIFINRSEQAKMEMLKKLVDEYKIDGVIFHDARTCFNNTNARFGFPQRLEKETDIPTLIIEGDLCDLRFFSEGQSITKTEAFIEQLIENKLEVLDEE